MMSIDVMAIIYINIPDGIIRTTRIIRTIIIIIIIAINVIIGIIVIIISITIIIMIISMHIKFRRLRCTASLSTMRILYF